MGKERRNSRYKLTLSYIRSVFSKIESLSNNILSQWFKGMDVMHKHLLL